MCTTYFKLSGEKDFKYRLKKKVFLQNVELKAKMAKETYLK